MNIKDLMTDDLSKVTEFAAACDDMCSSQYILAEGKIIKILQIIALSTELQRRINDTLKGFDYESAASRCLSTGKFDGTPRSHAALVFCILADIDSGKIELSDFLRKFFYKGDINNAYAAFCDTLIVPFKQYFAPETMRGKGYEIIERKAMDLADAIDRVRGLTDGERDEYIFMCDDIASKARTDLGGARALARELSRLISDLPELDPYIGDVLDELEA